MSKDTKKWFIIENIPTAFPLVFSLFDGIYVEKYFKNILGLMRTPQKHLIYYQSDIASLCYIQKYARQTSFFIFQKILKDPEWGIWLDNLILKNNEKFFDFCQKLEKTNFKIQSDKKLVRLYLNFFGYFHDSWIPGWAAVLVDFEKNLFSNYLLGYLKKKIKKIKNFSLGDIFSILTTPTQASFAQKEAVNLLKILDKINQVAKVKHLFKSDDIELVEKNLSTDSASISRAIETHTKDFCWLPYMYIGPAWNKRYFLEVLRGMIKQNLEPKKMLRRIEKQNEDIKLKQGTLFSKLNIDEKHRVLFEVAKRFVFSKGFRKDCMYYGCYVIEKLYQEIAQRAFLSARQVRYLYPWELADVLTAKKFPLQRINQRLNFNLHYSQAKKRIVLEGDKARKFLKGLQFIKRIKKAIAVLSGDCAWPGKARGEVRIINDRKDCGKMKKDAILVSYATSPEVVPAIKKAKAIVTDLGGITCHAAIISRELGIPCIVGTKMASQIYHDGDIIDVDATHGQVKLIKRGQ